VSLDDLLQCGLDQHRSFSGGSHCIYQIRTLSLLISTLYLHLVLIRLPGGLLMSLFCPVASSQPRDCSVAGIADASSVWVRRSQLFLIMLSRGSVSSFPLVSHIRVSDTLSIVLCAGNRCSPAPIGLDAPASRTTPCAPESTAPLRVGVVAVCGNRAGGSILGVSVFGLSAILRHFLYVSISISLFLHHIRLFGGCLCSFRHISCIGRSR
jgi:hypothetical protein